MSKVYPSDLTAAQFEWLASRLLSDKPLGSPRTTSLWAILNAIFYVLCEGCTWRGLPGDFPPSTLTSGAGNGRASSWQFKTNSTF